MDIKEKLTNVWKNGKPKQFAETFKKYAISRGLKQYSYKAKDNTNTYLACSTCGGANWNRVNCFYLSEKEKYGNENLSITLRKKAGSYLIIERKGVRVFEVDHRGIRHYEEESLNAIIEEHKPLFDILFIEKEKDGEVDE